MQTPSRKTLSTLFWTSMSPTHYLASLSLAMLMTASFGGILTLYWGKNILSFLFSRNERHIVFPKMLAQNCRDFSNTNTMYNKVYQILPLSKLWKKTGHFLPGLYITQIHVRQLPLFTGSRQGWNSEASSFRYDRVGEHQCLLSGGDSHTHKLTHTHKHTSIFDPVCVLVFLLLASFTLSVIVTFTFICWRTPMSEFPIIVFVFICNIYVFVGTSSGLYVRLQAGPKEWPDHSVHRRKLWVLPPSHNNTYWHLLNIHILWIFHLRSINANYDECKWCYFLVSHLTPSFFFFIRHSARKKHLSSPLGLLQNIR